MSQTEAPLVVAGVIVREGRVLLCQRPRHKHHGGLFELPGGKVEAGETLSAALSRELREELGVTVTSVGATLGCDDDHVRLRFLRCEVEGEPACHEHESLVWATLDEALALPLAPADRRFVEAVARGAALGERLPWGRLACSDGS